MQHDNDEPHDDWIKELQQLDGSNVFVLRLPKTFTNKEGNLALFVVAISVRILQSHAVLRERVFCHSKSSFLL